MTQASLYFSAYFINNYATVFLFFQSSNGSLKKLYSEWSEIKSSGKYL